MGLEYARSMDFSRVLLTCEEVHAAVLIPVAGDGRSVRLLCIGGRSKALCLLERWGGVGVVTYA